MTGKYMVAFWKDAAAEYTFHQRICVEEHHMKRHIKLLSLLLAACLLLTLAACGENAAGASAVSQAESGESTEAAVPEEPAAAEPEPSEESEASASEPAASEIEPEEAGPVLTEEQQALIDLIPEGEFLTFQEYPLSDDPEATLSVFYSMHPLLSQFFEGPEDLPITKRTEEITGVHIEYTAASFMAASTQMQLMVASGELLDIMPLAMSYTSGADAAVDEDLIVDLTDLLPEYAVNYQGLIDGVPAFRDEVTTADGRIVGFSIFSRDNTRIYISGPEVRKDWLDKLGLDAPETLDEYHDMLSAFKSELGVETPMWIHYSGISRENQLTRAFEINGTEKLLVDGNVVSSLQQPGFKEYLEMMHQWHSEGLFAQDFFSDVSREEPELAVVANDTYGLFYQYASEFPELKGYASDPDFEILAITDAVRNKGDRLKISNGLKSEATPEGYFNVTTSCEDIGLALKWLDFMYSPDGWLLANYGTEGESFEYDADGVPHWTELITASEYPGFVAKSMYTMLQGNYLMHAAREFDGYTQDMIDASDVWASVEAEGDYINMPAWVTLSAEVSMEIRPLETDIDTYVDESLVKFIIGDLNLTTDYDAFQAKLEEMQIGKVLDAYQTAYEEISARRG